jgi:phage/plasmid-associated DNA primase
METAAKADELREMAEDPNLGLLWNQGLGWLYWDGKVWNEVPATDALHRVNEYREDRGTGPWAPRRMPQLRAAREVETSHLDSHPDLLNVQNGVVDFRTGELRPHSRSRLMTRIAGAAYNPGAVSAAWDRILSSLTEEVQEALQLTAGQAATGARGDSATLLHGPGCSGKSTFARAVREALGSYAVHASDTRGLMGMRRDGSLRGARFAVAEEADSIRPDDLKLLVSPDLIVARRIRRDTFTHLPSHSLLLVANVWPAKVLGDQGAYRRTAVVGLSSLDARGGADPTLRRAIADEGPVFREAVLRWIVRGAVRWYAENGE